LPDKEECDGGDDGGGDGDVKEIRTSGFDLRHWKAMVRSSVSRAVKVAAGFGVDISGRCCMVG
jgi:hypothetical protein